MKAYLINWLNNNWKHLTVAMIIFIVNALMATGYISTQQSAVISSVLAALGLSLTTNSGTVQRVVSVYDAKNNGGNALAQPVAPADHK